MTAQTTCRSGCGRSLVPAWSTHRGPLTLWPQPVPTLVATRTRVYLAHLSPCCQLQEHASESPWQKHFYKGRDGRPIMHWPVQVIATSVNDGDTVYPQGVYKGEVPG